jgi:hypothetical protein
MKNAAWITALALAASPLLAGAALPPAPTPAAASFADDVIEVSIMRLTQIDWTPGKKLPKWIRELDGKKIRLKGYMATDTEEGTDNFRLTFDQCGCANVKASHFVRVSIDGDTTGYDPNEVGVEGTFSVGEETEDGFVTSLYRLTTDSVDSGA